MQDMQRTQRIERSQSKAETEGFYTISEAAALLQVSPSTVWRWIDQGKLSAYRVGNKKIRIETQEIASVVRPFSETGRRGGAMKKEIEGMSISSTLQGQLEDQSTVIENAKRLQRRILTRRKGRLLPESSLDITVAREERTATL